jgi:hypothetical protein
MLGKLERRTFKDAKDAEKFAAKLRTQYHRGIRGGVVDAGTAHNTVAAEKALADAGLNVSVIEAVRAYIDARAVLDPHKASLPAVMKTWADARKARGDDRTFNEAALAFITEKEMGWSDRYRRNIDQTMRSLPEWFKVMKLPDIDDRVMLRATKESATTQTAIETRMRHIKSLCSGKGRKKAKRGLVLLTVAQCAAMLRACQSPEERRAVALLLFAGIRPDGQDGEFSKLEWSAIKDGKIYISAEVSKTGTERIIPIRPRLARLIKGHPKSGLVMPVGWAKRIQSIRRAAGMNDPKYQDATRHAFASHHLVAYGEASTQAAIGHTEGSRTLFKHYRAALPEEAGKKYFGDHGKPAKKRTTKAKKTTHLRVA